MIRTTLRREIIKELGTDLTEGPRTIGIAIDLTSVENFKHIALAHEAAIIRRIRPRANDQGVLREIQGRQKTVHTKRTRKIPTGIGPMVGNPL